jgi:hypothetical protein
MTELDRFEHSSKSKQIFLLIAVLCKIVRAAIPAIRAALSFLSYDEYNVMSHTANPINTPGGVAQYWTDLIAA